MIPLPYRILAGLLMAIGLFFAGNYHGHKAEKTTWEARIEKERAEASEQARQTEHAQQEQINDALRKQLADLGNVNAGLSADLDRLRNRPRRPTTVPQTSSATCAGSTGAELSREDAEFLAGEAARADKLRASLSACYSAYDAVSNSKQ